MNIMSQFSEDSLDEICKNSEEQVIANEWVVKGIDARVIKVYSKDKITAAEAATRAFDKTLRQKKKMKVQNLINVKSADKSNREIFSFTRKEIACNAGIFYTS